MQVGFNTINYQNQIYTKKATMFPLAIIPELIIALSIKD